MVQCLTGTGGNLVRQGTASWQGQHRNADLREGAQVPRGTRRQRHRDVGVDGALRKEHDPYPPNAQGQADGHPERLRDVLVSPLCQPHEDEGLPRHVKLTNRSQSATNEASRY